MLQSTRYRGWYTLGALLLAIVHVLLWFTVWGVAVPPTIGSTSRASDAFSQQYWLIALSCFLPLATWRGWGWRKWLLVGICFMVIWLRRFAEYQLSNI